MTRTSGLLIHCERYRLVICVDLFGFKLLSVRAEEAGGYQQLSRNCIFSTFQFQPLWLHKDFVTHIFLYFWDPWTYFHLFFIYYIFRWASLKGGGKPLNPPSLDPLLLRFKEMRNPLKSKETRNPNKFKELPQMKENG